MTSTRASRLLRSEKVAHVPLCHSRMPFVRAYPRETQEMVFDAHDKAFAFFGGPCARGIYGNMKTAVDTIFVGRDRAYNRRFQQMCGHYLVEPVACTPASGWEKGQVENQVGVIRRRLFVPRPRFRNYVELNAWLEDRCVAWAKAHPHPELPDKTIWEVFQAERQSLVRRIGQETLFQDAPERSSLDEIAALIDWVPVEAALAVVQAAPRGEACWPPLAVFRALLLAVWHDLSDVRLAEALDDRASFRRFCGFARAEATPERTTFVRFRRELVRHGLDQRLFAEITAQLKLRAVTVKTGTLIDATVMGSASEDDGEARWSGHRSRKAIHGYKAHVGADAETAIVERIGVTPGNAHDGRSGHLALPDELGEVCADSAYRGQAFAGAVMAKGSTPRVVATHVWAKSDPASQAEAGRQLANWNGANQRVRGRIEKIFGTWKRSYNFKRTLNILNPA